MTVALAVSGCSTLPPLPPRPSGAIAVPTDENLVSSAESAQSGIHILCTLSAAVLPVVGVLAGDRSDAAWPVWLRALDGHQVYVRWPRGFSVRFDPAATLLDENGAVFLLAGSPITLAQVDADPAGGTKDRPYLASGIVETGLGHQEHCYVEKG
ncbi:MAG TPA: hypothetical protein VKR24_09945 [Candidatus Limnocylindrales bacterium]|nr:hypothetical protein [Candidatus Limnocylindrales bacterium]